MKGKRADPLVSSGSASDTSSSSGGSFFSHTVPLDPGPRDDCTGVATVSERASNGGTGAHGDARPATAPSAIHTQRETQGGTEASLEVARQDNGTTPNGVVGREPRTVILVSPTERHSQQGVISSTETGSVVSTSHGDASTSGITDGTTWRKSKHARTPRLQDMDDETYIDKYHVNTIISGLSLALLEQRPEDHVEFSRQWLLQQLVNIEDLRKKHLRIPYQSDVQQQQQQELGVATTTLRSELSRAAGEGQPASPLPNSEGVTNEAAAPPSSSPQQQQQQQDIGVGSPTTYRNPGRSSALRSTRNISKGSRNSRKARKGTARSTGWKPIKLHDVAGGPSNSSIFSPPTTGTAGASPPTDTQESPAETAGTVTTTSADPISEEQVVARLTPSSSHASSPPTSALTAAGSAGESSQTVTVEDTSALSAGVKVPLQTPLSRDPEESNEPRTYGSVGLVEFSPVISINRDEGVGNSVGGGKGPGMQSSSNRVREAEGGGAASGFSFPSTTRSAIPTLPSAIMASIAPTTTANARVAGVMPTTLYAHTRTSGQLPTTIGSPSMSRDTSLTASLGGLTHSTGTRVKLHALATQSACSLGECRHRDVASNSRLVSPLLKPMKVTKCNTNSMTTSASGTEPACLHCGLSKAPGSFPCLCDHTSLCTPSHCDDSVDEDANVGSKPISTLVSPTGGVGLMPAVDTPCMLCYDAPDAVTAHGHHTENINDKGDDAISTSSRSTACAAAVDATESSSCEPGSVVVSQLHADMTQRVTDLLVRLPASKLPAVVVFVEGMLGKHNGSAGSSDAAIGIPPTELTREKAKFVSPLVELVPMGGDPATHLTACGCSTSIALEATAATAGEGKEAGGASGRQSLPPRGWSSSSLHVDTEDRAAHSAGRVVDGVGDVASSASTIGTAVPPPGCATYPINVKGASAIVKDALSSSVLLTLVGESTLGDACKTHPLATMSIPLSGSLAERATFYRGPASPTTRGAVATSRTMEDSGMAGGLAATPLDATAHVQKRGLEEPLQPGDGHGHGGVDLAFPTSSLESPPPATDESAPNEKEATPPPKDADVAAVAATDEARSNTRNAAMSKHSIFLSPSTEPSCWIPETSSSALGDYAPKNKEDTAPASEAPIQQSSLEKKPPHPILAIPRPFATSSQSQQSGEAFTLAATKDGDSKRGSTRSSVTLGQLKQNRRKFGKAPGAPQSQVTTFSITDLDKHSAADGECTDNSFTGQCPLPAFQRSSVSFPNSGTESNGSKVLRGFADSPSFGTATGSGKGVGGGSGDYLEASHNSLGISPLLSVVPIPDESGTPAGARTNLRRAVALAAVAAAEGSGLEDRNSSFLLEPAARLNLGGSSADVAGMLLQVPFVAGNSNHLGVSGAVSRMASSNCLAIPAASSYDYTMHAETSSTGGGRGHTELQANTDSAGPAVNPAFTSALNAFLEHEKTIPAAELEEVREAMSLYEPFSSLDETQMETLVRMMSRREVAQGDSLVTEGERILSCLLLVAEGRVGVLSGGKVKRYVDKGQFFGEMEMSYNIEKSLVALQVESAHGVIYSLSKADYLTMLMHDKDARHVMFLQYINQSPFLMKLSHSGKLRLADSLRVCRMKKGACLTVQHESVEWMYLIMSGRVSLTAVTPVAGSDANSSHTEIPLWESLLGSLTDTEQAELPIATTAVISTVSSPKLADGTEASVPETGNDCRTTVTSSDNTTMTTYTVGRLVGEVEFVFRCKGLFTAVASTPVQAARISRLNFEVIMSRQTLQDMKRFVTTNPNFAHLRKVVPEEVKEQMRQTVARRTSGARRRQQARSGGGAAPRRRSQRGSHVSRSRRRPDSDNGVQPIQSPADPAGTGGSITLVSTASGLFMGNRSPMTTSLGGISTTLPQFCSASEGSPHLQPSQSPLSPGHVVSQPQQQRHSLRMGVATTSGGGGSVGVGGQPVSTHGEYIFSGSRNLYRFPAQSFDQAGLIAIAVIADGTIIRWNTRAQSATGFAPFEVVGQSIMALLMSEEAREGLRGYLAVGRQYAGNWNGYVAEGLNRQHILSFRQSTGLYPVGIALSVIPSLFEYSGEVLLLIGREATYRPASSYAADVARWLDDSLKPQLKHFQRLMRTVESHKWIITANDAVRLRGHLDACTALVEQFSRFSMLNVESVSESWRPVRLPQLMRRFVAQACMQAQRVQATFYCNTDDITPKMEVFLDAEKVLSILQMLLQDALASDCCGPTGETLAIELRVVVAEPTAVDSVSQARYQHHHSPPPSATISGTATNQGRKPLFPDSNVNDEHSPRPPMGHMGERCVSLDDTGTLDREGGGSIASTVRPTVDITPTSLRRIRIEMRDNGSTIPLLQPPENTSMLSGTTEAGTTDSTLAGRTLEETPAASLYCVKGQRGAALHQVEKVVSAMGGILYGFTRPEVEGNVIRVEFPMLVVPGSSEEDASREVEEGNPVSADGVRSFSVIVADNNRLHMQQVCQILWARQHAVVPVTSYKELKRKVADTKTADILIIDPLQLDISADDYEALKGGDPFDDIRDSTGRMVMVVMGTEFSDWRVQKLLDRNAVIELPKLGSGVLIHIAMQEAERMVMEMRSEEERIELIRRTFKNYVEGQHKIGECIGKGTYGDVYTVEDTLTGGKMAMKQMRIHPGAYADEVVQEILAMTSLQHENIIHYFFCEKVNDTQIRLYMELAPDGTLQKRIREHPGVPLSFDEIVQHLTDICRGLAYVHSQNYVHCDLKTANLLLGTRGRTKIGDFGTAKHLKPGKLLYNMAGTPQYMAPEVLMADPVTMSGYDYKADVWSVGCIVLEMATGRPPFAHLEHAQGMGIMKYLSELTEAPDISPLFSGNPLIYEFVKGCLEINPEHRPNAQELLHFDILQGAVTSIRAERIVKRAEVLYKLNVYAAMRGDIEDDGDVDSSTSDSTDDFFDNDEDDDDDDDDADDGDDDDDGDDLEETCQGKGRVFTHSKGHDSDSFFSSSSDSSGSTEWVPFNENKGVHEESMPPPEAEAAAALPSTVMSNSERSISAAGLTQPMLPLAISPKH